MNVEFHYMLQAFFLFILIFNICYLLEMWLLGTIESMFEDAVYGMGAQRIVYTTLDEWFDARHIVTITS